MAKKQGKRKGLKALVLVLIIVGGIAGMGLLGVLVANFVVMPLIVGRANEIEVPDVVGLMTEDAIAQLRELGFEASADERRPDTLYGEGAVVEQRPRAGSPVKKGRRIALVISSGPELKRVPYLLGLSIDQASAIAERHEFEISAIDTVQSDTVPAGRIVSMTPDPEIRVEPGTSLHLYVSAGPKNKTIPVPNLIDMPVAQAREFLEADSLIPGKTTHIPMAGKGGIVILQSPDPGIFLGAGDSVHLTVGEEP